MEKIISYIGSKVKLYDFLDEVILKDKNIKEKYIFFDLFAGTNSVSRHINLLTNWDIISNDLSKYSYILFSYLYFDNLNEKLHKKILNKLYQLNSLDLIYEGDIFNELSAEGNPKTIEEEKKKVIFSNQPYNSRMFFSKKVGTKIDTIKSQLKKDLENKIITEFELNILLVFVLFYADKNANTTSVYGAYLKNEKKLKKETDFIDNKLVEKFKTLKVNEKGNKLLSFNTNILSFFEEVKKQKEIDILNTKLNIIYLDPPYSTRSYESNYHILEYIIDLNFDINTIKLNSKTAQRYKKEDNPFTSKMKTNKIFKEMIKESIKLSDNIYISYNTDGLIKQENIEKIYKELKEELKDTFEDLKLITHKKNYKRFKSANSETKKLQEKINNTKNKEEKEKYHRELTAKLKNKKTIKEERELQEIIWNFKVIRK